MNKVIIIGCPGSGKTTFAEKLNKCTGLPLYYLDAIWHKPDKAHISHKYVDELGHLIDRQLTKDLSQTCDSRIILHLKNRTVHFVGFHQLFLSLIGVNIHRPEFIHIELFSVTTDTNLLVEGAAVGIVDKHRQRDKTHWEGEYQQKNTRNDQVKGSFPPPVMLAPLMAEPVTASTTLTVIVPVVGIGVSLIVTVVLCAESEIVPLPLPE